MKAGTFLCLLSSFEIRSSVYVLSLFNIGLPKGSDLRRERGIRHFPAFLPRGFPESPPENEPLLLSPHLAAQALDLDTVKPPHGAFLHMRGAEGGKIMLPLKITGSLSHC